MLGCTITSSPSNISFCHLHNPLSALTWNPVDWGGDLVLVASLERVDNTQDLGGVAAGGGWV